MNEMPPLWFQLAIIAALLAVAGSIVIPAFERRNSCPGDQRNFDNALMQSPFSVETKAAYAKVLISCRTHP